MPRYKTTLDLHCEAGDCDDVEFLIELMRRAVRYYFVRLSVVGDIEEVGYDDDDEES